MADGVSSVLFDGSSTVIISLTQNGHDTTRRIVLDGMKINR